MLFLFLLSLTWHRAEAETIRIEKSLHPAVTTISGSLSPFALAINGEGVNPEATPPGKLKLNGKPVPLQDEAMGSFYVQTEDDEVKLTSASSNEPDVLVYGAKLPRILAVEISDGKVRFELAERSRHFTLDGKTYVSETLDKRDIVAPISANAEWIVRPHVVELANESGPSRLYNLNFSEWRSLELRSTSIGLAPIGPPVDNVQGGYGVYFWRSWENRWVVSGSFNFAKYVQHEILNRTSTTKGYGINLRLGGFPFLPGQSVIDLRRLILGVFIGRGWSTSDQTWIRTDPFWISGVFFRETFLRFRSFGLGLQCDFGFFTDRPSNVNGGPELSYTW